MERRTAVAIAGVFLLICVSLGLLVLYPFSYAESSPPFDQGLPETATTYTAEGEITVDENIALAFEGVATADGAWYKRINYGDSFRESDTGTVISERYHPAESNRTYVRLILDEQLDTAERKDEIREDDDRTLLGERRSDGSVLLFYATPDTESHINGPTATLTGHLDVLGFSQKRTTQEMTVYEPETGWYDGTMPYRVTDSSGTLEVDTRTETVRSADVSFRLTEAGTYATYLGARYVADATQHHQVVYEFEDGPQTLEQPAWVTDIRSES